MRNWCVSPHPRPKKNLFLWGLTKLFFFIPPPGYQEGHDMWPTKPGNTLWRCGVTLSIGIVSPILLMSKLSSKKTMWLTWGHKGDQVWPRIWLALFSAWTCLLPWSKKTIDLLHGQWIPKKWISKWLTQLIDQSIPNKYLLSTSYVSYSVLDDLGGYVNKGWCIQRWLHIFCLFSYEESVSHLDQPVTCSDYQRSAEVMLCNSRAWALGDLQLPLSHQNTPFWNPAANATWREHRESWEALVGSPAELPADSQDQRPAMREPSQPSWASRWQQPQWSPCGAEELPCTAQSTHRVRRGSLWWWWFYATTFWDGLLCSVRWPKHKAHPLPHNSLPTNFWWFHVLLYTLS